MQWRTEDRGHDTPCWIWEGRLNDRGYGLANGAPHRLAHRAVFVMQGGVVPDGLELDHLCRVRACVNPAHLEAVTHAENTRRGAAVRPAVCDHPLAAWLRETRRAHRLSQRQLAERLGVTQALVGHWERGYCTIPAHRLEQLRRDLAESPGPEVYEPVIGARA